MATPDTTTFVGRGEELDSLRRVIEGGVRLVSIVGPPGAGKTRLATEFCVGRRDALFVDLTEVRTVTDLARTMGLALNVPISSADPIEQLGWALGSAEATVVVLDNCEQVIDVVRDAVRRWLEATDQIQFVATSREALRLASEIRISLGPLDAVHAVALFRDRARAVLPQFEVDDATTAALTELVNALDNLPLIIELAAARINVLPPAQLLKRLSQRLALIRDRSRATRRQESLRGAIDWSWEMLDHVQRRALARSSVFRGGFSLDAAEALLDVPAPIDAVEQLVEKSLLRPVTSATDPLDVRFRPYESVRLYADERLGDEERAALEDEHARWYARRAREWCEPLRTGGSAEQQVQALARLGEEYANLTRTLDHYDAGVRAQGALALDAYLEARGQVSSRIDVLSRVGALDDPTLAAEVEISRGLAELATGAIASASATLEQIEPAALDARMQAYLLIARSRVERARGRLSEAKEAAVRAFERASEASESRLEALGRANFAASAFDEHSRAQSELRSALRLGSRSGDARLVLQLRNLAGTLAMNAGEMTSARSHFERALPAARKLGDHRVVGALLSNIALADHYSNRLEEARDGFRQAAEVFGRIGLRNEAAIAAGNRAAVQVDLGEYDDALATIQASLEAIGGTGGQAEGIVLATEGNLYHARGDLERAAQRYDEALQHLASGSPHAASTRVYRALRAMEQGEEMETLEPSRDPVWNYAARVLEALSTGESPDIEVPKGLPEQLREGVETLERAVRGESVEQEPAWLFARLVARWAGSTERPAAVPPADADLVVDANGFWFRVDGQEVDIRRRGPARLILLEMARRPGVAFDLDELFEIGWPEQGNIDPEAADKRVYAAVATLRKLGLTDLLLTTDEGYLLDPGITVSLQGHPRD